MTIIAMNLPVLYIYNYCRNDCNQHLYPNQCLVQVYPPFGNHNVLHIHQQPAASHD